MKKKIMWAALVILIIFTVYLAGKIYSLKGNARANNPPLICDNGNTNCVLKNKPPKGVCIPGRSCT